MKVHQAKHTISMMGRVLNLSRAGYYAWLKREKSTRERKNEMLTTKIRELHLETRGIYGAPIQAVGDFVLFRGDSISESIRCLMVW